MTMGLKKGFWPCNLLFMGSTLSENYRDYNPIIHTEPIACVKVTSTCVLHMLYFGFVSYLQIWL